MKRPAKATHKPHKSWAGRPFARWPNADGARRDGEAVDARATSRTGVEWASGRGHSQASERVFAAVRPGFVAPCMVEAADRADGPFCGPRSLVGPAWAAVPAGLPDAANPSRATRLGPGPHGLMARDPDVKYRARGNRQREYLAERRGIARCRVGRIAAITARESTDAQDLRLATLSSQMYLRSNIFKFVMT
jgi:hypothetical protein